MWYEPIQTINIWGLQIQVWGLMLALGVVFAWYLLDYNLLWKGLKLDTSWVMTGFVISSLVGARVVHVLLNWHLYQSDWWEILRFWNGGMASFGAYIFGFTFLLLYLKKRKINFGVFLDASAGPMFLALFLARTGCFLINDHIGKATNIFWAIESYGTLRHPISLYYMLIALVIFGVVSYCFYTGRCKNKILWLAVLVYVILRLLVDWFFKDFFSDHISLMATIVAGLVLGLVAMFFILRKESETEFH